MGTDFIDYMIADPITIPAAMRPYYSEKIVDMPHSYQVNDNLRSVSETPVTRAEFGLPGEGFVFCCFNNNYKISPAEFDIWMRLLSQVEGSVLWLLRDTEIAAENLRRAAQQRGISPSRLVFADRAPLPQHLARHRCADLFLDTFNVNAHTTASDALWAGLPVITKAGRSFVARAAASLLHAHGLPELVTETVNDYEQLALELATDPARLARIRHKVVANRETAPLFDSEKSTRDLEAVYRKLLAEPASIGSTRS
jgi:predicted O-linked N-acetylglucosamine transferase (SPINDLY family)